MATPLLDTEIRSKLASMPGWIFDVAKQQIEKTFARESFMDGVNFIHDIAEIAEEKDHHPDLLLHGYKNVRVMLTTHSEGGVTQKDLDVAKEIDSLV